MVVSHNANEIRSTPVPAAANIAILAQGCDVGIDEAHFLTMKSYGCVMI
jgi:thymidine kinase